jgi:hypothetical protein
MNSTELTAEVHIVLVTCVRSEGTQPVAAKVLYISSLFQEQNAHTLSVLGSSGSFCWPSMAWSRRTLVGAI